MRKFRAGQIVEIVVHETNPNFDNALAQALHQASIIFGWTDENYLDNVEDANVTTDSIILDFKHCRYQVAKVSKTCHYVFDVWIHRTD